MHVNAYPECNKNALEWTREFKEYGYVLEYKTPLISIGTRILRSDFLKVARYSSQEMVRLET